MLILHGEKRQMEIRHYARYCLSFRFPDAGLGYPNQGWAEQRVREAYRMAESVLIQLDENNLTKTGE